MDGYGILTLVPVLLVIVFALKTKRTLESLILGTLCTYIITDGWGFAQGWMDAFSALQPIIATNGYSWFVGCLDR